MAPPRCTSNLSKTDSCTCTITSRTLIYLVNRTNDERAPIEPSARTTTAEVGKVNDMSKKMSKSATTSPDNAQCVVGVPASPASTTGMARQKSL